MLTESRGDTNTSVYDGIPGADMAGKVEDGYCGWRGFALNGMLAGEETPDDQKK